MKLLVFMSLLATTQLMLSCTDTNPYELYHCPMKCYGDKFYDKPGICPMCHIKLVGVESTKKK